MTVMIISITEGLLAYSLEFQCNYDIFSWVFMVKKRHHGIHAKLSWGSSGTARRAWIRQNSIINDYKTKTKLKRLENQAECVLNQTDLLRVLISSTIKEIRVIHSQGEIHQNHGGIEEVDGNWIFKSPEGFSGV